MFYNAGRMLLTYLLLRYAVHQDVLDTTGHGGDALDKICIAQTYTRSGVTTWPKSRSVYFRCSSSLASYERSAIFATNICNHQPIVSIDKTATTSPVFGHDNVFQRLCMPRLPYPTASSSSVTKDISTILVSSNYSKCVTVFDKMIPPFTKCINMLLWKYFVACDFQRLV
jgi:hypothetical protein